MRKKIVAGNWKMNTTLQEGVQLATNVENLSLQVPDDVTLVVCVPFTHLTEVKKVIKRTFLGAENCASEVSGAYTGEVSAAMVASTGAQYVIIGHSERRTYYKETDEILAKKVNLALSNNLTPIFCIGELLDEREANRHFDVVKSQLEKGLFNLSPNDFLKLVIAYEPVWAIGTGKTATSEQAQEMHYFIRNIIAEKYGKEVAKEISILYGGSCNDKNAAELFANPDVDGGLIGGASLKADSFIAIAKSF